MKGSPVRVRASAFISKRVVSVVRQRANLTEVSRSARQGAAHPDPVPRRESQGGLAAVTPYLGGWGWPSSFRVGFAAVAQRGLPSRAAPCHKMREKAETRETLTNLLQKQPTYTESLLPRTQNLLQMRHLLLVRTHRIRGEDETVHVPTSRARAARTGGERRGQETAEETHLGAAGRDQKRGLDV